MTNVPGADKQIAIVAALAEGSSIRGIERMTGVHRDTIMRLGVKIGRGCMNILDAKRSPQQAVRVAIIQEYRDAKEV